jgi:hypothetical protein
MLSPKEFAGVAGKYYSSICRQTFSLCMNSPQNDVDWRAALVRMKTAIDLKSDGTKDSEDAGPTLPHSLQ